MGRDPRTVPPVDPPTDEDLTSPRPAAAPLYLRHEFRLPDRPVRARLYATARGVYEPRLNGARVGDTELAPGWTEYHQRLQYQTYDVTDVLHAGPNVVAAIVADGWSVLNNRLTVTVTVPPGSTAVLEIPTTDPTSVCEDGTPAADRPGVLGVEPSAAGASLRLTSGRYTFTATTL